MRNDILGTAVFIMMYHLRSRTASALSFVYTCLLQSHDGYKYKSMAILSVLFRIHTTRSPEGDAGGGAAKRSARLVLKGPKLSARNAAGSFLCCDSIQGQQARQINGSHFQCHCPGSYDSQYICSVCAYWKLCPLPAGCLCFLGNHLTRLTGLQQLLMIALGLPFHKGSCGFLKTCMQNKAIAMSKRLQYYGQERAAYKLYNPEAQEKLEDMKIMALHMPRSILRHLNNQCLEKD